VLFRRRSSLGPPAREALARLLTAPTFELIPLKTSMTQAAFLPPGSTVSVTASPAKGIEATVALCEQLQAAGFRAVPHLSARMVRDRAHLVDLIAWLEGAGVDRAFVVGGDAKEPGAYPDGLALLRGMADIGHPLSEIGIPAYPQGHPFIADGPILEALHAKAAFAEMGADPIVEHAKRILRLIDQKKVVFFTRRDLHQAMRSAFRRVSELDQPLAVLVDHGFIRARYEISTGPGRPLSPTYDVNPLWASRQHQAPSPGSRFEDCEVFEYRPSPEETTEPETGLE